MHRNIWFDFAPESEQMWKLGQASWLRRFPENLASFVFISIHPALLRLTSRKPLWLDLQPVNIKSRWRHNWKSAQVVNSHLVCNPTIRQPGFDLPRQCGFYWTVFARNIDTAVPAEGNGDLETCGEIQTMSHIVEYCPLTKLNGGLSRLHSADEDAVS